MTITEKGEMREALFQAVQTRETSQKQRVAFDLRIQAVERGDDDKCQQCGMCISVCPFIALSIE